MRTRIFHGWFVVAACFVCMLIANGVGWFSFPVFLKPFESEFGWTRAQITGAVGVWAVGAGIFSPIVGHFIDRWGPRRIMLAGIGLMGLSCLGLAGMSSLTHLYVVAFLAAIGTTASTYMPVASIISQWFVKRRGVAMSIAMMGMSLGGFIMPNVSSFLIEYVGWRWTYRIFAAVVWVLVTPGIVWFVRSGPSDSETHPDAGTTPPAAEVSEITSADGFTIRQAFKMRSFWGIGIADLTLGIALLAIQIHMVAFAIDAGIDDKTAAFAYSLIPGVALVAMIGVGAAADRFNRRLMISLSYGLPAAGVLLLFGLKAAVPLFCFSVFFGVLSAGRSILWPLVVNDCFGRRAYATVMGFLFIFYTIGVAIGPPLAGYIFDTTKSYYLAFLIAIAVFVASGISMAIGAKSSRGR